MIDLEKIKNFAQNIHAQNNDGHGFDHIARVVALAEKILLTEPSANRELVLAACYLHDTYDEKICDHIEAQKAADDTFLAEIGLGKADRKKIFYIIDNMSFSANLTERKLLDIDGQIVQDADRLEAMGATMIVRALEYGWAHDRLLYDPSIQPNLPTDKELYHSDRGSTINHFYEKAFLLYDLLNTEEARRIGKPRDKIMHDFVTAYEHEYEESH